MSSGSCSVCGCNRTQVIDGLKYCAVCSTQIEDFRELGHDDDDHTHYGRNRINTKKQIEDVDETLRNLDYVAEGMQTAIADPNISKRGNKALNNTEIDDSNIGNELFDELPSQYGAAQSDARVFKESLEYCKALGSQLSNVTKTLAKCAAMMHIELKLPKEFPQHTLAIFQLYLAHCDVAFVDSEFTEEIEKMYRAPVIKIRNERELLRKKRKRKADNTLRAKRKLEQSTNAWELLMGDTFNENLEASDSSEEENEEENETQQTSTNKDDNLVQILDTKLSKLSYRNAHYMPLDNDVIVSILYISAATLGLQWIMLSDVVRWFRENRAMIGAKQLKNMIAKVRLADRIVIANYRDLKAHLIPFPLYELYRIVLLLWQSIPLPIVTHNIDLEQMISRMIYNLNLPSCFMENVMYLAMIAPPTLGLDMQSLKRQGDIENGFSIREWINYRHERYTSDRIVGAFGQPPFKKAIHRIRASDFFLTIETKLMALILLTLKLIYGLDGKREFHMKSETLEDDEPSLDVVQWMYQLRMRLTLWQGTHPRDVLQQIEPNYPINYDKPIGTGDQVKMRTDYDPIRVNKAYRESGFQSCVPHSVLIDKVVDDKSPFHDAQYDRMTDRLEQDSIYSPLHFQAHRVDKWMNEQRSKEEGQKLKETIDKTALKVVKMDFRELNLSYAKNEVVDRELYKNAVRSDERCGTQKTRQTWYRLFPCARGYVKFPRPLFTDSGTVKIRSEKPTKKLLRWMKMQLFLHGERRVYASITAADDALEAAKRAFSQSFEFLLKTFAIIIGETESVLYAAFLMLEMQILEKQQFEETRKKLMEGSMLSMKAMVVFNNRKKLKVKDNLLYGVADTNPCIENIDLIRFGMPPKNWGKSNIALEKDEDDDMPSEFSSSSESEDYDDYAETEHRSDRESSMSSPKELVRLSSSDEEGNNESSEESEGEEEQEETRRPRKKLSPFSMRRNELFEFEKIWQLITMRYW